jgi:adenosine deaminase
MTAGGLSPRGADESLITVLPKVDLHLHQEWSPRLDRVLARREHRAPYNWEAWAGALVRDTPPGMPRLRRLSQIFPAPVTADANDENFIARFEDLFREGAAGGAVLVEVRIGNDTLLRPGCIDLIREAEHRVRLTFPAFHASTLLCLLLWDEPGRLERVLDACIGARGEGLDGVDLLYQPYDTEADWSAARPIAERLSDAGLGITAHAGEFSPANLESVLGIPGLTRIGHATQAASDPRLLDLIAERGVTVECCLSCNVVLGAVPSLAEHPIRRLIDAGIPVALGTDDPVQVCTTIEREYVIASHRGFSTEDLLEFTRNGLAASFIAPEIRGELVGVVDDFEASMVRE